MSLKAYFVYFIIIIYTTITKFWTLNLNFKTYLLFFFRLQYQIKNTDMTTMMSIGGPLMLVTQLLIIPFLR